MTSKLDIVKALVRGNSLETADKYLADDFKNLDREGNVVMDRAAYFGLATLMYAAFDDFNYVATNVRQEGDDILMTGHLEGRHVNDFDLSAMGLGVIPATGRKIVWPDSTDRVVVEGDKIVSLTNIDGGNDIETFLAPLREAESTD